MHRRAWLAATLATLAAGTARAHHGWGSFDSERPLYLEGTVRSVRWQNPHVELVLDIARPLALPADLARRALPAQTAPVDRRAMLAKAVLPTRQDVLWKVELAPLTRMAAWKIEPIRPGARIAVVGFSFPKEEGDAVLRAEYLFLDGQVVGLRSSPA